jgi:predicted ATPase
VAFNGDALLDLAAQILALAQKQGSTIPLMIGYRLKGTSLLHTGDIAEGRAHLERAIALYDPAIHRPLAPRFVHDIRVTALGFRALALWLLGYPVASLADAAEALKEARQIGHAGSLMFALWIGFISVLSGDFVAAIAQADELSELAESKGTGFWKPGGMVLRGLAMAGSIDKAEEAARMITAGLSAPTGATALQPFYLSYLATAYGNLGQFDDARRTVRKATNIAETTKQVWCEAEVYRIAGEIARKSPERDDANAEAYFNRALDVARQQQAKSWELRAAMSMARLRRDRGKRAKARELLAPVYGWFTEGFDTLDLKEAKAVLDDLA